MSLEELLSRYQTDSRVVKITDKIKANPRQNFHLTGILGSFDSIIAASIFKLTNANHLFLFSDKEEAAYFQNNLKGLLDNKEVFFFPDSFKRPGKLEDVDNNNILLRTETVNRLSNSTTTGELIVSYSEALFEKVLKTETLNKNKITIKLKEQLDIDFIMDVLIEYGFERVDFVYEPGQFSIRGDIVDVFSFGNEMPYRIELFGDEVESIRTFDPTSQLSERKIAELNIVPNIQTHFNNAYKTSLFNVLPENTIVWVSDLQFTLDRIAACFDEANKIYQALNELKPEHWNTENHFFEDSPIDTFELPADIIKALQGFSVLEIGSKSYMEDKEEISFNIKPQPSFNKNFDLLITDLNRNTKKEFTNFIFSENPKQIERFYSIFEDLSADVLFHPIPIAIHQGFIDNEQKTACYTDHQIFERYHRYKIKKGYSKDQALLLKTLKELSPGDYVTHIDYGVGKFSGLEKIEVNGHIQESVRLIYKDGDLLYVNINALHKISKYTGKEGQAPKINKLGTDAWATVKRRTKKKIKDIAEDLIKLYAERKAKKGFAYSPDTYLQNELEASFIYEDTPDQEKSTIDFKKDMEEEYPMDRLVCGDVGFGKTEIAVRAAFKAVADSKQVAVLVPTTILSMQHYKTFKARLKDFPATIDYINRFKTAKDKTETLKKLADGKVDILIGTHALAGNKVKFKDLGLLIIDEEQKFGVTVKEKLRQMKVNVDTLTLTATPIPRTMQFSLLGARDLSVMTTPPPNRQPIETQLNVFDDKILKEAIEYEVYRGGQVFFVHNRVKDIYEMTAMMQKLCPGIDFGVAHGQMDGKKLEDAMLKFENREYDVLVCTNIVESGLDIPNANTIIINNAHWFGLSDLHQLRGRVGRSNKKAFCYLFTPPLSGLPHDTRRRLKTIEEFADLGSGFNIAMRDLDIRGAGNLLGGEQSGFIAEIGYETYHKILDEAISELKQGKYKDLYEAELEKETNFVRDTQIDTDLEMLIPGEYIKNTNERLNIYTELDNIDTNEKLLEFEARLIDRFGPIPKQAYELMNGIKLRWVSKKLGFERIIFKNKKLRCYFVENQESFFYQSNTFGAILKYVQTNPKHCSLKQTEKYLILIFEQVHTMNQAKELLEKVQQAVAISPVSV